MERMLKKRVSKKEFLRICAGVIGTGFLTFSGFNFVKKPKVKSIGYGEGVYGGN